MQEAQRTHWPQQRAPHNKSMEQPKSIVRCERDSKNNMQPKVSADHCAFRKIETQNTQAADATNDSKHGVDDFSFAAACVVQCRHSIRMFGTSDSTPPYTNELRLTALIVVKSKVVRSARSASSVTAANFSMAPSVCQSRSIVWLASNCVLFFGEDNHS